MLPHPRGQKSSIKVSGGCTPSKDSRGPCFLPPPASGGSSCLSADLPLGHLCSPHLALSVSTAQTSLSSVLQRRQSLDSGLVPNPGRSYFEICNLIISAKILFPNKITLTGARRQDLEPVGGGSLQPVRLCVVCSLHDSRHVGAVSRDALLGCFRVASPWSRTMPGTWLLNKHF